MQIRKSSDGAAGDGKAIVPGPSGKGQLEAVSELKEFGKWNSRVGVKIAGKWFSIVGKAEKIQAVLADVDEGDLVEYTSKENRWTAKDGNQNIDFWITSLKRTSPATREGQEDVHVPVPEEKLNAPTAGNVPARERPVLAESDFVRTVEMSLGNLQVLVNNQTAQLANAIGLMNKIREIAEHGAEQAALTVALLRKELATEKPAGEVPKTPLPPPAPGLPECKHENTHLKEKVTPIDGITRKWLVCDQCNAEINYRIFNREGQDITNQRQLDVREVM